MSDPVSLSWPFFDAATPPVGARCVAVRGVPHARWMYSAPAVYEVRARKSDGALTWRCVDSEPVGRYRSKRRALAVGIELAGKFGIPMLAAVRHGRRA